MNFMENLAETITNETNYSLTENGALGFRTTKSAILDLNFSLASFRGKTQEQIETAFARAYAENPVVAMTWLFYARDAREGLGERDFFRAAMKFMSTDHPDVLKKVLHLISEYGRWDDLVELVFGNASYEIMQIIKKQLWEDVKNMGLGKSVSLLAKWLPSENTSSKDSIEKAEFIRKGLGLGSKRYRKTLSSLRKYIDVVERKMSAGQWSEIDYQRVPSRANLIYNKAFLRNDEERRREFLSKLEKGEVKINASTLFPHDIVHQYANENRNSWYGENRRSLRALDATLEGLWKALPNTVGDNGSTLVVCDSSGSMDSTIPNTNVAAIEVSNALAIYFAERCSGAFKDQFITFSARPEYVNLRGCTTLRSKLSQAYSHDDCSNTNIEAVFYMILKTAIDNKMKQDELPKNILIISDMEFNPSCHGLPNERLFETIEKKFADFGYDIPRLVFWNVNSRTKTIPVTVNKLGVALVSGFSVNIAKMVMSGKTDPYDCLIETLESERYLPVREALMKS